MKKLCMKQQLFYRLIVQRATQPKEYVEIWKYIGEFKIDSINKWGFISYEVSARMSELWRELPQGILQRIQITGKSGAQYYAYRINPTMSRHDILAMDVPEKYKEVILLFG